MSVAATGLPSPGQVECYKNNAVHVPTRKFLFRSGPIFFPDVGYSFLLPVPLSRSPGTSRRPISDPQHAQTHHDTTSKHGDITACPRYVNSFPRTAPHPRAHPRPPSPPVCVRRTPPPSVPSTVPSRADMRNCAPTAPTRSLPSALPSPAPHPAPSIFASSDSPRPVPSHAPHTWQLLFPPPPPCSSRASTPHCQ